ncbi:MAG TPA: hypothetical protein VHZ81_15775 [Galbitalea sp.]|nr:hypothetical protein [Galbitalea sp.]
MRADLAFFLDRGLGSRILATGLRAASWSITTMDERYGVAASPDVADPDWIRDASGRGEILVSKDRATAKRPLEAEAIYYSSARALVISSGQIALTGIFPTSSEGGTRTRDTTNPCLRQLSGILRAIGLKIRGITVSTAD